MIDKSQIRDAATIVLLRRGSSGAEVLMGQRGKAAAFMPEKFVFPGGAVDAEDYGVIAPDALDPVSLRRLQVDASADIAPALAAAAVRELWEETGLALAADGAGFAKTDLPEGWRDFDAAGHKPAARRLCYVFRAITPPGRPRRFDARFFVAFADAISGDADDFSRASGELSHLGWVPLPQVRSLSLPFITEVVLAEVEDQMRSETWGRPVPFFDNRGPASAFNQID